MKCIIEGLSGAPMLCDPIKAANHLKYAEKYGVIDGVLDMFFNPVVKPYVYPGRDWRRAAVRFPGYGPDQV